ncbi:MAG: ATP-binding protein [Blastocatellia bacterium]|nr:ATP-binding protein [Blastocatellia bacterium]
MKVFVRRHALWIGIVAVAIPLAAHLWLQYESLRKLQATLPVSRRAFMRQYLSGVLNQTMMAFEERVDVVLNVPAGAFRYRFPDREHISEDQFDIRRVFDWPAIANHFRENQFRGARLFFVSAVSGPKEPTFAVVRFYDPVSCSFAYFPTEQERGAAHAASASWTAFTMVFTHPNSLQLTVDERDPKNRAIVKPIVDENSRVLGVAGMFVDENYFLQEALATEIGRTLPQKFPEDFRDAVIAVFDRDRRVLFANQPFEGAPFDVNWPIPFLFKDRYISMKMRTMTEEQYSRRYFIENLTFSILTALVLLGGIALTLRAASRAMKLSQMKAEFVSNVSHELRTPLASIRVFGEFLKLGRVRDREKIHEYGEYIETESRRLTQLINNILDFSKIESGQKTYKFEPARIEQVVRDTLRTFEIAFEQNGFTIRLEASEQALPEVVIDTDAIGQAFINLLDNAVKYSGESKEIVVKLGVEGEFVAIAVRDRGVGIAREEIGKVFDKFYRVGNNLVHDVKGSGLGLSIVKHIIEAHRGKVMVESEPGRGSTFIILLPLGEPPQSAARPGRLKAQLQTYSEEMS